MVSRTILFAVLATQHYVTAVTTHVSKGLYHLQLHTLSYTLSHHKLLLSMHLQQRCQHMTQPRSRLETSLRSCLNVSHDAHLHNIATLRPRFEISLHSCLAVSHVSVLNTGAGGATVRPRCPGSMALVESQEVGAAHHLPPLQPLRRPQNQQKRRRWGLHHALQPAVQPEVSGGPHEAYGLLLTGVQAHSMLCCTVKLASLCSSGRVHQTLGIHTWLVWLHAHAVH